MTTYALSFVIRRDNYIAVGDFTGEQIDELMTLIFDDPRVRDEVWLNLGIIERIVNWHREVTDGSHSDAIENSLQHHDRMTIRVQARP